MPFTYTGRSVKPGGAEAPSLTDIAVGLSRQPRFAGQGRRWFSVLDHSFFVDEIVKSITEPVPADLRLAMLLHDAHEAITADVPTTFKNSILRLDQGDLDQLIMDAYFPGRWPAYADLKELVKQIDRRALVAEARVIGPAVSADRILDAFGITETVMEDGQLLSRLLSNRPGWFGTPPTAGMPENQPGVREFLDRYVELR